MFLFGGGSTPGTISNGKIDKGLVKTIKSWVAEAVDTTGAVVMVTELQCTDAGCPPFDTVMALLKDGSDDKRILHCSMAEVTRENVIKIWSEQPV
mmetsp:Transcript_39199/g.54424  ORF Transcript_39199/g.54424 Transcript_39199/m.54424 type:complete len:95 (-) Transcript_39199:130-414(-)